MNIKISSKDVKIPDDIEQSVEKKITQRLKKYNQKHDADNSITVRVTERKPFTRVDIDMPYLNYSIHAEAETTDGVLGGIDKCMDILERQIAKYKTRMHRAKVKSSSLKQEILDIVPDDVLLTSTVSDDAPLYKIVKVDSRPQPMSMDEAVLQMEVLDFRFLVFFNIETDNINVIYRRDDGHIGLIEA